MVVPKDKKKQNICQILFDVGPQLSKPTFMEPQKKRNEAKKMWKIKNTSKTLISTARKKETEKKTVSKAAKS